MGVLARSGFRFSSFPFQLFRDNFSVDAHIAFPLYCAEASKGSFGCNHMSVENLSCGKLIFQHVCF